MSYGSSRAKPHELLGEGNLSAVEWIDRALAAHGGREAIAAQAKLDYDGVVTVEGHYRRPGDTRDVAVRVSAIFAEAADAARLESSARKGESWAEPDTEIARGASVAMREDYAGEWRGPSAFDADSARAWTWSLWPRMALLEARANAASAGNLGLVEQEGRACWAISMTDANGIARTLLIDPSTGLLAGVQRRFGHPRLGDVTDTFDYLDYEKRSEWLVPLRIRQRRHEQHHTWWSELTLREGPSFSAPDATTFESPEVQPEPPRAGEPLIEPLFDRVWSIRLAASQSRAFVFEFEEFLICMEAPLDSPTGEALVAAVRGRWPDKPVRYAVASHYHPHYTGGLRACIAEGAILLTSPGNESFMRELAERRFTLEPDALARAAPKDEVIPRIEIVSSQRVIEDRALRVELHDIGAASDHTDEFLIAYVPMARSVFHGDLGAAREDGALLGKSRLAGMVRACLGRGLSVDWLLQSWPLEGCRDRAPANGLEP